MGRLLNNQSTELMLSELISVGQRMYRQQYVVATDGNISIRKPDGSVVITPTGCCLGDLTTDNLIVCNMEGGILSCNGIPSSELPMHLKIYQLRPDVHAIVHAHPVSAVALTLAGLSLSEPYLPEIFMTAGTIPTAPFATPSTEEVAESIADLILNYDSIILDRHGALTIGINLWDAFWKLERLEFAAKVVLAAHQTGKVSTLSPDQIKKIS